MADDDLAVLAERPGWTVYDNKRALYAPVEGGWHARVSRLFIPARGTDRFHVALITPAGVALYTQMAVMVGEARRVAEGWVRGKQPGI
jgi:hypothetical protein